MSIKDRIKELLEKIKNKMIIPGSKENYTFNADEIEYVKLTYGDKND